MSKRKPHLQWSRVAPGELSALPLLVNCRPNRNGRTLRVDSTVATTCPAHRKEGRFPPPPATVPANERLHSPTNERQLQPSQ